MPELFEAIKQRRSTRKYQTKPVPKQLVEEVLEITIWAPSAHNAQPWRFIILADDLVKRELAEAMAEAWAADMAKDGAVIDAEMRTGRVERFASAPALILACTTMEGMNKFPDKTRQSVEQDLAIQSFGAAMQNLLLAAHSKGLGACWFCAPAFCKETVRKTMKIPDDVDPQALIALGYPNEKPPVPPRKPLGEYCFRDKWGGELF